MKSLIAIGILAALSSLTACAMAGGHGCPHHPIYAALFSVACLSFAVAFGLRLMDDDF